MGQNINYDTSRIRVEHVYLGMPKEIKVGSILTLIENWDGDCFNWYVTQDGSCGYSQIECENVIKSGSNCLKQLAWFEGLADTDFPEYLAYGNAIYMVNHFIGDDMVSLDKPEGHRGYNPRVRLINCKPATRAEYELYQISIA